MFMTEENVQSPVRKGDRQQPYEMPKVQNGK